MRPVLLALVIASSSSCHHASAGCPAPVAELVADPSACVIRDVAPSTDVVTVTCSRDTVRGPIVDIHFPDAGTYGYAIAPGPTAHLRYGVSPRNATDCTCVGVDTGTNVGFGGFVLIDYVAGDTTRLFLDADSMGTSTWQVAVCPDGAPLP